MNNYNLDVSYINIWSDGDPAMNKNGGLFIRFNDNSASTYSVLVNITHYGEPIPQPRTRITMGSLYSNNAQVYYKSHTLAPGGIGGVRNYRLKSRKT
jgi:hypothetical protein